MSTKRFFQLSFFLPLTLPLFILLFKRPTLDSSIISWIISFSLLFGGIPYLLFIIGLFIWMRGKSAEDIRRVTYLAPVLFIPVFLLCVLLFLPIQYWKSGEIRVEASGVVFCSIFIIILGYMYVFIANACYLLLKSLGVIKSYDGGAA